MKLRLEGFASNPPDQLRTSNQHAGMRSYSGVFCHSLFLDGLFPGFWAGILVRRERLANRCRDENVVVTFRTPNGLTRSSRANRHLGVLMLAPKRLYLVLL